MQDPYIVVPDGNGKAIIARPHTPDIPIGYKLFPIEMAKTVADGMCLAYEQGWSEAQKAIAKAIPAIRS